MKKVIVIALAVLLTAAAGCETMKGLGRDISKAGDKIEDAAKK